MQDSRSLRYVDRYVGSIGCKLLSLVHALAPRARREQPQREQPQRVLLVELFEMGASIMLLPSIAYLRAQNPNVEIHCLTTSRCVAVWRAMGAHIDEDKIHVMQARSALGFLWAILTMVVRLRRIRFDLIIDYELFMRISALLVGVLRAKARAGFFRYAYEGLSRGTFYDGKCPYNQNTHIARNFLALTKVAWTNETNLPNAKLTIDKGELHITPMIPKASEQVVATICGEAVGRFIMICPDVGPTLAVRNYPPASFTRVVDQLLSLYPEHKIVVAGTQDDHATAERILQALPSRARCLNVCGKTSFSQLLELISAADLLLTNDNGPAHFATLTGTRVLALFSTDSPWIYGPLGNAVIAYTYYQCSPCISALNHKFTACTNNRCLQALPPERVVDLVTAILEGKATFRSINNDVSYLP